MPNRPPFLHSFPLYDIPCRVIWACVQLRLAVCHLRLFIFIWRLFRFYRFRHSLSGSYRGEWVLSIPPRSGVPSVHDSDVREARHPLGRSVFAFLSVWGSLPIPWILFKFGHRLRKSELAL